MISHQQAAQDLIHAATQALVHPYVSHVRELVTKAEAYLKERGYGIDEESLQQAISKIYASAELTNEEARRHSLSWGKDGSPINKADVPNDFNVIWVDNYGRNSQVTIAVTELIAYMKEFRGFDLDAQTAARVVKSCPPPAAEEHMNLWLGRASKVAQEFLADEAALRKFGEVR